MSTPWTYLDKEIFSIEDLPDHENLYGFVYVIKDKVTGKIYVGKKAFTHNRKKKISQRMKKYTGTRKTYERTKVDSKWAEYYGSSKELLSDIQKYGKQRYERKIVELCCTKKYLSYCEVSWQMRLDVLKRDSYNGNILGRYFPKDMNNCVKS